MATAKKSDVSLQVRAIAGAASGTFSRMIVQPFDLLKIRFQLQIEPLSRTTLVSTSGTMTANVGKYDGRLINSLTKVVNEEGMLAIWKGHASAQIQAALFSLIQFTCYEQATLYTYNIYERMHRYGGQPTPTSAPASLWGDEFSHDHPLPKEHEYILPEFDTFQRDFYMLANSTPQPQAAPQTLAQQLYKGTGSINAIKNTSSSLFAAQTAPLTHNQSLPALASLGSVASSMPAPSAHASRVIANASSSTGSIQNNLPNAHTSAVYERPTTTISTRSFTLPAHTAACLDFFAGGLAGSAAAFCSQPFDVMRTRFVAQGEPKIYRSFWHAGSEMLGKEGPKVFFRGFTPTVILLFNQVGLQFAFYNILQRGLTSVYTPRSLRQDYFGQNAFIAGGFAGIGAKVCVYPFDLLKRRLQVQGFESARASFGRVQLSRGISETIIKIAKEEGLRGFYKGLYPSLVKSAISGGVRFFTFERLCSWLNTARR